MQKEQLLNYLLDSKDIKDDVTVGELKIKLQEDINKEINDQIDEDNYVVNKYNGKYLRSNDKHNIIKLGEGVDIIFVEEIEPNTYTQNWERTFQIKGTKIYFGEQVVNKKEISEMASFTIKDLEGYDEISVEVYWAYEEKYKLFKNIIKSVGIKQQLNEKV